MTVFIRNRYSPSPCAAPWLPGVLTVFVSCLFEESRIGTDETVRLRIATASTNAELAAYRFRSSASKLNTSDRHQKRSITDRVYSHAQSPYSRYFSSAAMSRFISL
jgi:hypothetical protein